MITLRIVNRDKKRSGSIFVDILWDEASEKGETNEQWIVMLEELANSGRQIVFCIEEMEPDGFFMLVLNVWLNMYSKKVCIYTSQFAIQEILRAISKGEIEFLDDSDLN